MTGHPDCFGTMFPSIREGQPNVTHKGKVFSFRIVKTGTFVESRKTETDPKQWKNAPIVRTLTVATGYPRQSSPWKRLYEGSVKISLRTARAGAPQSTIDPREHSSRDERRFR